MEVGTPDVLPAVGINKVPWGERSDRVKTTKIEPIKPVVEPPEIVSVEMSTDEQDVYALMGVSPLLRLNREVKNPKAVIVNVTAPGQTETTEEEIESFPPVAAVPTPTPVKVARGRKPQQQVVVEPVEEPVEEVVEEPVVHYPTVEAVEEQVSNNMSDENDTSTAAANRRRRRRSSALDSDS